MMMEVKVRKWSHANKFEVEMKEVSREELENMGLAKAATLHNGVGMTMQVKNVLFSTKRLGDLG